MRSSAWWDEPLRDRLKRRERFAARRMGGQRSPARDVEQRRVCLAGEAQNTGHGDVRVTDGLAEPERGGPTAAVRLQRLQHAHDLRYAAIGPLLRGLLMQGALIDEADRLVGEAGREGADLQRLPAGWPAWRDQGFRRAHHLIEMIEDRGAVDQHLAIIEHQG